MSILHTAITASHQRAPKGVCEFYGRKELMLSCWHHKKAIYGGDKGSVLGCCAVQYLSVNTSELMVWLWPDTAGARGLSAVAARCQTHSLAALFTLILQHYREFIDITHQMTNRESYIGAVLKRRHCVYPKVLYAQCGFFLDYFLHIQKKFSTICKTIQMSGFCKH